MEPRGEIIYRHADWLGPALQRDLQKKTIESAIRVIRNSGVKFGKRITYSQLTAGKAWFDA